MTSLKQLPALVVLERIPIPVLAIGHDAVLDVDVGDRASILSGAVVNRTVPDHPVTAGIPARIVKTIRLTRQSGTPS
jgi:serine acetyltransferase